MPLPVGETSGHTPGKDDRHSHTVTLDDGKDSTFQHEHESGPKPHEHGAPLARRNLSKAQDGRLTPVTDLKDL